MALEATTQISAPQFDNIPEELKRRPQWVCWLAEMKDGRLTKIPYTPGKRVRASSTDSLTWRPFDEAVAAYKRGEPLYHGIGFVFSSGDPYTGIDLDGCRNPETGEIEPWARKIIGQVQEGYVEASVSGTGVHVIVEATLHGGAVRKGPVEMYSAGRYFTMSGKELTL